MINQNWVFGRNAGLDFSTNPPTATSGFSMNTFEGCASVSDAAGNLLFYTDGVTVWDAANTPVVTGLLGDASSTQSSIIVPDPASPTRYYIFTMDGSSNASAPFNHFDGILLDVAGWTWVPISSLLTLPSNVGLSPAEKLTAVQIDGCLGYWVIIALQRTATLAAGVGPGMFRVFRVDASGLSFVGDTNFNEDLQELGYLRGSPDGRRLAIANGTLGNVLVFPFDNVTGAINVGSVVNIPIPTIIPGQQMAVYGVEFSPNSDLLYYGSLEFGTGVQQGHIFQVDVPSASTVSTYIGGFSNANGRYAIGALQRGMDDVIYIAMDGEASISAITSPNTPGTGCNLVQNYVALMTGSVCYLGLPNIFPNPCIEVPCDCDCDCHGCNDNADAQDRELLEFADKLQNVVAAGDGPCKRMPNGECDLSAIIRDPKLEPCFFYHWENSVSVDDHEVVYITACNPFNDIQFNGLRITAIRIIPPINPREEFQIVPDRFVSYDCLPPCSCLTREFALLTGKSVRQGGYRLEFDYCFDNITVVPAGGGGTVAFEIEVK
jgi:uncharacterized protein YuzB (UPF0349 family)